MNITLEESTNARVTPLLDVIVRKILSSNSQDTEVKKDLLFALVIVLLIENGFMPVDDNCEIIDPFQSIDKQQISRWKLSTGLYEACFILGRFKSTTLKVVMSPVGANAFVNAIISDLNSETYSMCLPIDLYVISPQAASIPMMFGDLKHFSITFKNSIITAVKSRILSHCGYPSASLIGVPDEILYKIILFLSVSDVINLCSTCNRLRYLLENESLWHNMCIRDFKLTQNESKEWKEIYKETYIKEMEKKKGVHRSAYSGIMHDYMDYSDYVSHIENPLWNELT